LRSRWGKDLFAAFPLAAHLPGAAYTAPLADDAPRPEQVGPRVGFCRKDRN
jgi:hypothetical protein